MAKEKVEKAPRKTKPTKPESTSQDKEIDAREPKELGDCCFAVDSQDLAATIKSLISTCIFGLKEKSTDFGDDGSSTPADALLVIANQEKQQVILKYAKFSVFATARLPAKVFAEGAFVISATVLQSLGFRGKTITLTLEENTVRFVSGASRGSFQVTGAPEDVEMLKPEPIKCDTRLGADFIKDIVQKVMFPSQDSALPSFGMPLCLRAKDGDVTLIAHDNICAALIQIQDAKFPDINVVLPGSALIKAVQACGTKQVSLGVSDRGFRVSNEYFNVYHPLGVYDLFDVMSYMENEVMQAKPDLIMHANPVELHAALSAALSATRLQSKAPGQVEIKFDAETLRGSIGYHNDVVKTTHGFRFTDIKGKRSVIETDGPRLLLFLGHMRMHTSVEMRLYDNRIFLTSADNTMSFVIPER